MAIKAKGRAAITAHNDRAWLAWQTAFLPQMKRPPRFSDLTRKADTPADRKAQAPVELDAVMKRWRFATAAMKPVKK